jgi:hypothetical protein
VRRRLAAVAVATALATALTACDGGGGEPREPTTAVQTRLLDRLSKAIEQVNAARTRLAKDTNALAAAAGAIDDVDDVAVKGDRDAVRARRQKSAPLVPQGDAAAGRLGKDVRAYRAAVAALDAAKAEGLDAAQQRAVAAFVAAANRELDQLKTYSTVVSAAWPRYRKLDEAQGLWLARASNGWYRDTKEAAGNYAVMTDRKALARDRRSLAAADGRRLGAARAASAAAAEARRVLAPLLG